jgi:hypothetical protein
MREKGTLVKDRVFRSITVCYRELVTLLSKVVLITLATDEYFLLILLGEGQQTL